MDWRLLVKERIVNIGIPLDISGFCCFNDFLYLEYFLGFGFLPNQPTVHMGELAGGGSAAVAVGVSDRCKVTCNMRHMTLDTQHLTPDT